MSGISRDKTPLQIAEEQLKIAVSAEAAAAKEAAAAREKVAALDKKYWKEAEQLPQKQLKALGRKVDDARRDEAWAAEKNAEAVYEVEEMRKLLEQAKKQAKKAASPSKKKKTGSSKKKKTGGRQSRKKRCRQSRKKRCR